MYYAKSHPTNARGALVPLLLLLAIGFMYVNNFTLMLTPQRWLAMYRHSPAGANLNWREATLIPRYLHFVLGSFAIAGLAVFVGGVWQRSTQYGQWLLRHGSRWFVVPTVINYLVGMWFLVALPRPVLLDLFATNALGASLIGLGMLLPIAAVAHVVLAARPDKTLLHARLAIVTTLLTLVVMVAIRQLVRSAYVAPFLRLDTLRTQPQWGVIALFVGLFVGGLVTLYLMLKQVLTSRAETSSVARAAAAH